MRIGAFGNPRKPLPKTLAKAAEQIRRRALETGFNNLEDACEERVRTIREIADDGYCWRLAESPFADKKSIETQNSRADFQSLHARRKDPAQWKPWQKLVSPHLYPAFMLTLNTGMRDAEMKNLTWAQIDFEKRCLSVGRSKTEAGEGRTIQPRKSDFRVQMCGVVIGGDVLRGCLIS